jgi:hypothetical protein
MAALDDRIEAGGYSDSAYKKKAGGARPEGPPWGSKVPALLSLAAVC